MLVKVWFVVVHHQAVHCLSVSVHAEVTGCTYKWFVETGHSPAGENETDHRPVTGKRATTQREIILCCFCNESLRYTKKETTSCMFNSILPEWVSVSQSDQKGEIWDREFLKHWFAYTNETSYNWWELIFFLALIELQLSLNFFKRRTDWSGVEFRFI